MKVIKRCIKEESGFAAVLFAFLMPVLLALACVVLDGCLLMYNKAKLEAATEAAALSTIAAYDPVEWEENECVVLDEDTAAAYAEAVLQSNCPGASLSFCIVDEEQPDQAVVGTTLEVETVFGKIYNQSKKTLSAQATNHGG